jgi:hypothetical protein
MLDASQLLNRKIQEFRSSGAKKNSGLLDELKIGATILGAKVTILTVFKDSVAIFRRIEESLSAFAFCNS